MTAEQALQEKHKVKLQSVGRSSHTKEYDDLPEKLRSLIEESFRLYDRVIMLDKLMHADYGDAPVGPNPFSAQLDQLRAAFETDHIPTQV